ncbi:inositol phosphorylceramide glucuronosyltransferase 1 [Morus notabilis]|uniref:inositol phosphorylceramide glucuronosyltransferase 1 n=1 Tax=Morus notabilis TaxID=981085 RepID=UPI000CECE596|nr:inositol phosphorylceramide glucuronosyltransferase 1 [Morus notabilis]
MRLKPWFFVLVTLALVWIPSNGVFGSPRQKSDEAYVTLLYGDEFLLGVRVLGKSIRDTRSTKDMVVLVSDGVSDYAMKLLEADGWIVTKISLLANPNQVRPKRFWGVYTKLKIFNMTNYKKVVYLDADTIVVKSIEDLFKCGKFCANLKHSERLNSGVMVVESSQKVFDDMMSKVNTLESYTGGDQGFLNSYYAGFANAHVFEPNLSPEVLNSRPVPEMERLSTLYNADVGLYMLANKWMVNESELRVIHYTLGPLKPWDWWTSWLLKPVDVWQNVREQLPESLPGTGGGSNPNDNFLVKFLLLLPFCALLVCYYRSFLQTREYFSSLCRSSLCDHIRHIYIKIRSAGTHTYAGVSTSSNSNPNHQAKVPTYLGGVSVFFCFTVALVALALGLAIVPRQVMPWTGLLLMYEWTFTIFSLLFGGYLHLIYQWGKATVVQSGSLPSHSESLDYDSGKGHQRLASSCDIAAWYYGLGMAFLAIVAPSVPCFLGITALFGRLALIVAGGLILASFMTYASEHLAIRSFLRGLEDRDTARSRKVCFFC